MLRSLPRRFAAQQFIKHGRFGGLYQRLGWVDPLDWAAMLKARGTIYAVGNHLAISPHGVISNPEYLRTWNRACAGRGRNTLLARPSPRT